MEPVAQHLLTPDISFDGGDLDCGGGLLLLIRRHIDPMPPGGRLEIRSTEPSVDGDLPAWCRMTGNELISWTRQGTQRSFLICKGAQTERREAGAAPAASRPLRYTVVPVKALEPLPAPAPAPPVAPLSVMGIGSWPRPKWLLRALHDYLADRLPEAEFQSTADDAVRLALEAQLRAGVDVVTDGEQRRDSYASFVGRRLDNCLLIPLTDLTAMVDHPAEFERELRALDVPASEVRHPVVFGPLGRRRPRPPHEFDFLRGLTDRAAKVALPGPYLLTRTMWLDCLSDRPYASREALARDVVRVLREEIAVLLAAGVALVQLDEPVLTEVVFTGAKQQRSFMCGALSERAAPAQELDFAGELLAQVLRGFPADRTALHICRGNWTRDENAALRGDYGPLLGLLRRIPAGTLFLELCTQRAGDIAVLKEIGADHRIGVGVVNQKLDRVEPVEEIQRHIRQAIDVFGRDRVLLTPDCGFATFADNPVNSAAIAEQKLRAIVQARDQLRRV